MSTFSQTAIPRPVPMELWGKDHWSTLAYAEVCAVDGIRLDLARLRCNVTRHPSLLSGRISPTALGGGTDYPTRLRGGVELPHHDDWDCLSDAQHAGLLVLRGLPRGLVLDVEPGHRGPLLLNRTTRLTGFNRREYSRKITVRLMPLGYQIVGALRRHKAEGGNFAAFAWEGQSKDDTGVLDVR